MRRSCCVASYLKPHHVCEGPADEVKLDAGRLLPPTPSGSRAQSSPESMVSLLDGVAALSLDRFLSCDGLGANLASVLEGFQAA